MWCEHASIKVLCIVQGVKGHPICLRVGMAYLHLGVSCTRGGSLVYLVEVELKDCGDRTPLLKTPRCSTKVYRQETLAAVRREDTHRNEQPKSRELCGKKKSEGARAGTQANQNQIQKNRSNTRVLIDCAAPFAPTSPRAYLSRLLPHNPLLPGSASLPIS